MNIIKGSAKEIQYLFAHAPIETIDGVSVYQGFDFMSPDFFEDAENTESAEYGSIYLVATDSVGNPRGVLKTKRFGIPLHNYIPEEKAETEESYVALHVLDVYRPMRQQGIAKRLIQTWSTDVLRPDDTVVGGKVAIKGICIGLHTWISLQLAQRYVIEADGLVDEWLDQHECDHYTTSDF